MTQRASVNIYLRGLETLHVLSVDNPQEISFMDFTLERRVVIDALDDHWCFRVHSAGNFQSDIPVPKTTSILWEAPAVIS